MLKFDEDATSAPLEVTRLHNQGFAFSTLGPRAIANPLSATQPMCGVQEASAIHEFIALHFRPRKVFFFRASRASWLTLVSAKTACSRPRVGQIQSRPTANSTPNAPWARVLAPLPETPPCSTWSCSCRRLLLCGRDAKQHACSDVAHNAACPSPIGTPNNPPLHPSCLGVPPQCRSRHSRSRFRSSMESG